MRGTLRALVLICCLAAFAVIGGGHWAVLQTVAWTQMIVDYTRDTGSLRQGLANTFDGAHPCELCHKISTGIAKESGDARQKPLRDELLRKGKLTAILPATFFARFFRQEEPLFGKIDFSAGTLADTPPVPPPRLA